MQNRPDGSGMAFFGTVVLGAVVLWFGSYVVCGSFQKAIRMDSGPMLHDEAIYRSLHIRKKILSLEKNKNETTMSKGLKLLIGFLTILPIGYMIFFLVNLMSSSRGLISFDTIFKLHLVAMGIIIGLFIFYTAHIVRTNRIANDKKIFWVIGIFMGSSFVMAAYWFLYLWSEPEEEAANIE